MGGPGRHIGSFHDSVSWGYVHEAWLRSQQSPGFTELASSGGDRQENTHGRVQGVLTEAKVLVLSPQGKGPVS